MNDKKTLTTMEAYFYLSKKELCHQVHYFNDEIIFYHWNAVGSQLIESLIVKNNKIHKIGYSRDIVPALYQNINAEVIDNFNPERHKFIKVIGNAR